MIKQVRSWLLPIFTLLLLGVAFTLELAHAANKLSIQVNETAGSANLTIAGQSCDITFCSIDYSTMDGSARAGIDYSAVQGQLFFATGSQTITVPIIDNKRLDGSRSFTIVYSNPVGLEPFPPDTITIVDDDSAPNGAIASPQGAVTISAGESVFFGS